jgi:hypothetical protein
MDLEQVAQAVVDALPDATATDLDELHQLIQEKLAIGGLIAHIERISVSRGVPPGDEREYIDEAARRARNSEWFRRALQDGAFLDLELPTTAGGRARVEGLQLTTLGRRRALEAADNPGE